MVGPSFVYPPPEMPGPAHVYELMVRRRRRGIVEGPPLLGVIAALYRMGAPRVRAAPTAFWAVLRWVVTRLPQVARAVRPAFTTESPIRWASAFGLQIPACSAHATAIQKDSLRVRAILARCASTSRTYSLQVKLCPLAMAATPALASRGDPSQATLGFNAPTWSVLGVEAFSAEPFWPRLTARLRQLGL
jgi:hypothetical protein